MRTLLFILAVILGMLAADSLTVEVSLGTTKQHHDLFKALFGDLDNALVASGAVSNLRLHQIGAKFDLCSEIPGNTK